MSGMIHALLSLQLALPNLDVTPGIVRPLTTAQVCAVRWGLDQRHVTPRMKRLAFERYGIPVARRSAYVIDHWIPRELAGADHLLNLFPQPTAEAKLKDRTEHTLHRAVCAGTITLAAAQQAIVQWGRTAVVLGRVS